MSDLAVRVENLSKRYRIGGPQERYKTIRETMTGLMAAPFHRLRRLGQPTPAEESMWALQDVSLEVKHGEVLGIIGPNGAGKTTLLKILSRITEPTEGQAEIHGRVGSLLEVGTGFHPELTGRENIYLNGAILGMRRAEISMKFDEIVEFAEIEKFLDTPVKRYSSGMHVRLAFAVAAHLEPEILLVDEVLAVGDAVFQKKSLGKMEDVAKEGRTVLFVSHNMGAISNLTRRSILLNDGSIVTDGDTSKVVSTYIASSAPSYRSQPSWQAAKPDGHPMQITQVRFLDEHGHPATDFDVQKGLAIEVEYQVRKPLRGAVLAVNVHARDGTQLLSLEDSDRHPDLLLERRPGSYRSIVEIPGNWLNSGIYRARVGCGRPGIEGFENIQLSFTLVETGDTATRGHRRGHLLPMLDWRTQMLSSETDFTV